MGLDIFLMFMRGPSVSKNNKVILKKGMILSNEPGYYLKNNYGIRIENLIYIDKENENLRFKNLTLVPIDIDMINFKMLSYGEKKYLFDYHTSICQNFKTFKY